MHWLRKTSHSAEFLSLSLVAGLLVLASGFAMKCHVEQHQMLTLVTLARQRNQACLELGWRWEADDQEHQYNAGSSAGTSATVGPISGFVMDVTENEYGHAAGECHAINATYQDLLAGY